MPNHTKINIITFQDEFEQSRVIFKRKLNLQKDVSQPKCSSNKIN